MDYKVDRMAYRHFHAVHYNEPNNFAKVEDKRYIRAKIQSINQSYKSEPRGQKLPDFLVSEDNFNFLSLQWCAHA